MRGGRGVGLLAGVMKRRWLLVALGWLMAGGPHFFCGSLGAADAARWQMVLHDEFAQADGTAPDATKWAFDLGGGGWGNNELQSYTARPQNVRVERGNLVIEARREDFTGTYGKARQYTSARLTTQGLGAWTYGRFEARIKVPAGQGIWPACWMLGTNITSAGWPACGEIDILENIGREPRTVHGTVHGPGFSGAGGIGHFKTNAVPLADAFHVYAVEWEPGRIRCLMDEQVYFAFATNNVPAGGRWVFDRPFFLLVNVAVGGNWPGSPDATTVFPQQMLVDYVRVYALTNAPPKLRLEKKASAIELRWPAWFPPAALERAAAVAGGWMELEVPGAPEFAEFSRTAMAGFFRLRLSDPASAASAALP